jgi:hypothetical protein
MDISLHTPNIKATKSFPVTFDWVLNPHTNGVSKWADAGQVGSGQCCWAGPALEWLCEKKKFFLQGGARKNAVRNKIEYIPETFHISNM